MLHGILCIFGFKTKRRVRDAPRLELTGKADSLGGKSTITLRDHESRAVTGLLVMEMEVLDVAEARKKKVGMGRKHPNKYPALKEPFRPETKISLDFTSILLDKLSFIGDAWKPVACCCVVVRALGSAPRSRGTFCFFLRVFFLGGSLPRACGLDCARLRRHAGATWRTACAGAGSAWELNTNNLWIMGWQCP